MSRELAVVIPAFRCEDTIEATLDSVANQSRAADHVVIVLDEPNPGLEAICRNHRVNAGIIVNNTNLGVGATRNIGFRCIKDRAEWVCFLDSDDLLHPEFFEIACAQFELKPDTDAVFGRFVLWLNGETQHSLPARINKNITYLDDAINMYLSNTGKFLLSFALFCTKSIESISIDGKINAEILRNNQDFEFFCRLFFQGVIARIESECGWHKKMPNSLSSNQARAWYFRSVAASMLYTWFEQREADNALLARIRLTEHSAIRRSARLFWEKGDRRRAVSMLFSSIRRLQAKSLAQLLVLIFGVQRVLSARK